MKAATKIMYTGRIHDWLFDDNINFTGSANR